MIGNYQLMKLKKLQKTKAIICPHIYGQMTDMTKLIKIKKTQIVFN